MNFETDAQLILLDVFPAETARHKPLQLLLYYLGQHGQYDQTSKSRMSYSRFITLISDFARRPHPPPSSRRRQPLCSPC